MINLLKIGPLNIPITKWLDLSEEFDKIYIYCNSIEERDFLNGIKHIERDNQKRSQFIFERTEESKMHLIIKIILLKLGKYRLLEPILYLLCWTYSKTLFKYSDFLKKYKRVKNNIDFVLSSYNDFDRSFYECTLLKFWGKSKPIIRSYKEHRCKYNFFEKYSLKMSTGVILPSLKNKTFFEKFYKIKFKNFRIADEDWRNSFFVNYIFEKSVYKKMGVKEKNTPHIVILTGIATYKKEIRSGSRYNYINLIENLLKCGMKVTLHAKKIVSNREENISCINNPYTDLEKKYNTFRILPPLNFNNKPIHSYQILSNYDAGILHNIKSDEKISIFSKMNIPNRFYDYIISGVIPLVIKQQMDDIEELINCLKFGIICKNVKDFKKEIINFNFNNIETERIKSLTFKNYAKIIRTLYESIKNSK